MASTAASRTRVVPATEVNLPPRYSVRPERAILSTLALGWGWKLGLAVPVAGSSMASRSQGVQPPILLNSPPAYRWAPSALLSSESTALSGRG
jgi:hypothetical protein